MKILSKLMLILASGSMCAAGAIFATKTNNNDLKINGEEVQPEIRFDVATTMANNTGRHNTTNDYLRITLYYTNANGKSTSAPTLVKYSYNDFPIFDHNLGSYQTKKIGVYLREANKRFYFDLDQRDEWVDGHEYTICFPKGKDLCGAGLLENNQYLNFTITNPSDTSQEWYTPRNYDVNGCVGTTHSIAITSYDNSRSSSSLSSLSVKTHSSSSGGKSYLYLDSDDIDFTGVTFDDGKTYWRNTYGNATHNDIREYNFWDKIQFSNDGETWYPSALAINGRDNLYFNYDNSDYRFTLNTIAGDYSYFTSFKYLKVEAGTELPRYQYMRLGETPSCYVVPSDLYFTHTGDNWNLIDRLRIHFNSNGGTEYEDRYVFSGAKFPAISEYVPKKPGYAFECWKLNGVPFTGEEVITTDITLDASYYEPYNFVEFGYWNNEEWYNSDSGLTYLMTTLRFNGNFEGEAGGVSFWDAITEEIGVHTYLNGTSFRDIQTAEPLNRVQLWWYTGDCGSTYDRCAVTIAIEKTYFESLALLGSLVIKIDEGTPYRGRTLQETRIVCSGAKWALSTFSFKTLESSSVKELNGNIRGMSFETRIGYYDYQEIINAKPSTFELGTYIILRSSYESSSYYGNIKEYLAHTAAGSTTYVDVKNTKKDFINTATAETDGYYAYKGSLVNIKEGNTFKDFIPVGYLKVNSKIYYGQDGSYATSLYATLKADTGNPAAQAIAKSYLVLSSTSGSFELKKTYSGDGFTISPTRSGYYSITPTSNISKVVVDGVIHNQSITASSTKYIKNENSIITFKDNKEIVEHGFAEPTHELWPSDLNQAPHNTSDNNALVIDTLNAKSIRVWTSVGDFIPNEGGWPAIGLIHTGSSSSNPNRTVTFDSAKVANVRNILKKYRDAGATEITLLVNNFIRDSKSKIFTGTDGNPACFWDNKVSADDWRFNTAFPTKYTDSSNSQITEEYTWFLNENKQFYKLLATQLDGLFDSVETANEINLRALDYDRQLNSNFYESYLASHNNVLDRSAYLAEASMDYCKIMTEAFREVGSSVRTLAPSLGVVSDSTNATIQNSIGQEVTGVTNKRSALSYTEECLKYIQAHGGRFNDYFQGLNLHPYLWLTGSTDSFDCYLYMSGKSPKGNVGFENLTANVDYNPDYATDWGKMIDMFHNLCENYGHKNCPFYLTEYGTQDNSNKTGTSGKNWANWWKNGFVRQVMLNIENEIQSREYITATYYYRIYDYKEHSGTKEPNFGLIDVNGDLKDSGVAYYYIINGTEYTGDRHLIEPAE